MKETHPGGGELVCGGCRAPLDDDDGDGFLHLTPDPGPSQTRPLIFHPVTPINLTARQRLSLMTMPSSSHLRLWYVIAPDATYSRHFRCDFWHRDGESAKYPRTRRLSLLTRPRKRISDQTPFFQVLPWQSVDVYQVSSSRQLFLKTNQDFSKVLRRKGLRWIFITTQGTRGNMAIEWDMETRDVVGMRGECHVLFTTVSLILTKRETLVHVTDERHLNWNVLGTNISYWLSSGTSDIT